VNYERERYVRVYTRDTPTMKYIGWEGRAVLAELLRKVDREGRIGLDGFDAVEALCCLFDMPPEVVRPGLQKLLHRGTVEVDSGGLLVPNFEAAQEWVASDAERARRYRARQRETVTLRHAPSRSVTEHHESSPLSDPIQAKPNQSPTPAVSPPSGGPLEHEPAPVSVARAKPDRRKPRTACPASGQPVNLWCDEWGIPFEHAEFGKFVDHHRKLGNLFADWGAAWRTWLGRAPEFAARGSPGRTLVQPAARPGEYDWQSKLELGS
jgi:hypothetical protein